MKKIGMVLAVGALIMACTCLTACKTSEDDAIVLRVSNWEEYIDLGDWDEDELIDLEDGTEILGLNSMVEDFEEWYLDTYGKKVKVEYSTFGTNEELYNQLTIGDTYDLVCPSEYMIMKMMREGMLVPYSADFYDSTIDENYYAKSVSPYIKMRLDNMEIGGEQLSKYAAGYMWGTLGLVYNPDEISEEEASQWDLLWNDKFKKQVTIKDSVRDAYFAAITKYYHDDITTPEFLAQDNYNAVLSQMLNRTDKTTVDNVEELLTQVKDNVYAFETDAGKADMVTGKVLANEQWSGDAVYTMDQAEEDGLELCYAAPVEGTNLWFDGWAMLKSGISQNPEKQQVAEAFVNFISMPENAIRNMYYIGYTSVVSGGESDLIFDYIKWNYEAEDDEEDTTDYMIGYFFANDMDEESANEIYCLTTTKDQTKRQLYAQYPTKDVVDRSVIMACFEDEDNARINRMWTNVRCFDLKNIFKLRR